MDDMEENPDFSTAAELTEANGETLSSSEMPDLGIGDAFSLDAFLNTESENIVTTETAPEEFLSENSVDPLAAADVYEEQVSVGEDAAETVTRNSWLADEPEAYSEENEKSVVEPTAGSGWLMSSEEDTAAGENVSGNGWLSEENTLSELGADESVALVQEETVPAEQAVGDFALPDEETAVNAENSWLNQTEETDISTDENTFGEENAPFESEADVISDTATEDTGFSPEESAEVIPAAAAAVAAGNAEMPNVNGNETNFVKWYSGTIHDEMFEVSKSNLPETINGSAGRDIIHINVGYDSYGWLIEFDNGLMMSLEDVRKYQIKNGALPSSGGVIRYGQKRCAFSDMARILIYRSVRYFSYGA